MELECKMVYLLLGSNLGDRRGILNEAISRMEEQVGELISRSAFYETAAWGREDQPSFLNIAVGMKSGKAAEEILTAVLGIEKELGRVRKDRWDARLIDIDIILYGDEVINNTEQLQIPHPRMQERRFVLEPLAEIAGSVVHPVLHQNILTILSHLNDNLAVTKIV